MRRLGSLLAALLLPSLALAQAPQRDDWYVGFGLGTGDGRVSIQGSTHTLQDVNAGHAPTNVAVNFKIGFTLEPTLLGGFDLGGLVSRASQGGVTTSMVITNYDAALTYFPWQTGFHLRSGAGLSVMVWHRGVGAPETYFGPNLMVGVGHAFWLGERFNLTANLDLSVQKYGAESAHPNATAFGALWLGFDWY